MFARKEICADHTLLVVIRILERVWMMQFKQVAVVLVLGFSLAHGVLGCGAILSGTHDNVVTDSNPQAAEIWMDGAYVGKTPLVVEVDSTEEHDIVFKLGEKKTTVRLRHKVIGGAVFLDLLLLPTIVPIVVDAATGGWYRTAPGSLNVDFEESGGKGQRVGEQR